MIPQFSLNLLFKHDQENLPGLMAELVDWCQDHKDTEIKFFDLGSHDDSRAIIEKWAASAQVSAPIKIVDVLDYGHFSQVVGLALKMSVGQVSWVGAPADFPKTEELEHIFGLWNDGAEIIWGFKPSPSISKISEPLLRRVEKNYPQSFADQFFEQDRGAFMVCDRKVMITHGDLLTTSSTWWRHAVAAGWSMDRWTLKDPVHVTKTSNTSLLDVLVLWMNQGAKPLHQLLFTFAGLSAVAFLCGIGAVAMGAAGIEIFPLYNSLYFFGFAAFGVQFMMMSFVFLFLARRWDRGAMVEKPMRHEENNLREASTPQTATDKYSAHKQSVKDAVAAVKSAAMRPPATFETPAPATVTPITQAAKFRGTATIIAPEETNVTTIAPEEESPSEATVEATPTPSALPFVQDHSVAPAHPEPAPAPEKPEELAPTQIMIMSVSSKSS